MDTLYGYGLCKGNPTPQKQPWYLVPPFWVPGNFGDDLGMNVNIKGILAAPPPPPPKLPPPVIRG